MTGSPQTDLQPWHRHFKLDRSQFGRFWLNISIGPMWATVGLQRRIADPPAIPQTRHYVACMRLSQRPYLFFARESDA